MKNMNKIGRMIVGLMYLIFGLVHMMKASEMGGIVPDWMPGTEIWVYLIGVLLIMGGAALIIDKFTYLAAMGLALLMMVFILTLHIPGLFKEGVDMMDVMPMLLKDMGLMGACLIIAHEAKS